jgi:hypothetical protein
MYFCLPGLLNPQRSFNHSTSNGIAYKRSFYFIPTNSYCIDSIFISGISSKQHTKQNLHFLLYQYNKLTLIKYF